MRACSLRSSAGQSPLEHFLEIRFVFMTRLSFSSFPSVHAASPQLIYFSHGIFEAHHSSTSRLYIRQRHLSVVGLAYWYKTYDLPPKDTTTSTEPNIL